MPALLPPRLKCYGCLAEGESACIPCKADAGPRDPSHGALPESWAGNRGEAK